MQPPQMMIIPIERLLDCPPGSSGLPAEGERLLCDADVVIAFHPFSGQEIELYRGSARASQMLRVLKVSLDATHDRMPALCQLVRQVKGRCVLNGM